MADSGICVTGGEPSRLELQGRLRTPADLHEIRLDLLDDVDDGVFDLISGSRFPIIATCRPSACGGGFRGTDGERLQLLRRAASSGARYVDLELDTCTGLDGDDWTGLPLPGNRDAKGASLVVSEHDFSGGPGRIGRAMARLNRFPAPFAKLAVKVRGAADLAELASLEFIHPERIVIGMGAAGLWTRIRPGSFGSAWTYVAATEQAINAPGQVDLQQAEFLRLREHKALRPMALIGGDQVPESPGTDVYNRLFHARDLSIQYLPLPAGSLNEALSACRMLGVRDVSVTAPFKREMARACRTLDIHASSTGVVNTATQGDDGNWSGWNTDVTAALGSLGDSDSLEGRQVLILGAGSTAASVGHAARSAGARVICAARTPRSDLGAIPWAERGNREHDVLVNCTPLGSDGRSTPWDPERPLGATMLLDVALRRGHQTPLVERFMKESRAVVSGLGFWCRQGAHQMTILTGSTFSAAHLGTMLTALGMDPATSGETLPKREGALALVGMRGSGKTTVGRRLADRLGRHFLDTDQEVVERLKLPIADLFRQGREQEFRRMEKTVLLEALLQDGAVVATGGGAVEDPDVLDALSRQFTVWLEAPAEALVARCLDSQRPPLTSLPLEEEVPAVLKRRADRYANCSRMVVSTTAREPEAVCDVVEHTWRMLQDHDVR